MSKKPSKSAVRGYFVLGSIAALAAIGGYDVHSDEV